VGRFIIFIFANVIREVKSTETEGAQKRTHRRNQKRTENI